MFLIHRNGPDWWLDEECFIIYFEVLTMRNEKQWENFGACTATFPRGESFGKQEN